MLCGAGPGSRLMRALRRHHRVRLKRTRRHYWGRDLSQEPVYLARCVDTPCPCSCWMCRNARQLEGETIQERRALDRRAEWVTE